VSQVKLKQLTLHVTVSFVIRLYWKTQNATIFYQAFWCRIYLRKNKA